MKKNKLYIVITIITFISFLGAAALCNQAGGEGIEVPTLKLIISEGPTFSEEDNVCTYEVEAITTGTPEPEIEFNLDDNVSLLSAKKAKVILNDSSDSYTLEATAANSEGSTSASINLSWGCLEEGAQEIIEESEEVITEDEEDAGEEDKEEANNQDEDSGNGIDEDNGTDEELSAPELSIFIYEGPNYSSADDICYYRIASEMYGNPYPELSWSKDDSNGSFGDDKVQVNLRRGETCTLTATATNSEGTVSRSIDLEWGCDGENEESAGDGNGHNNGEELSTVTISASTEKSGINIIPTHENYYGEIFVGHMGGWNLDALGFIHFDLESIYGKDLRSAVLRINADDAGSPKDQFGKLILESKDKIRTLEVLKEYPSDATNISYSGDKMLDIIEFNFSDHPSKYFLVRIFYEHLTVYSGNTTSHGISFDPGDAVLEITYSD